MMETKHLTVGGGGCREAGEEAWVIPGNWTRMGHPCGLVFQFKWRCMYQNRGTYVDYL